MTLITALQAVMALAMGTGIYAVLRRRGLPALNAFGNYVANQAVLRANGMLLPAYDAGRTRESDRRHFG